MVVTEVFHVPPQLCVCHRRYHGKSRFLVFPSVFSLELSVLLQLKVLRFETQGQQVLHLACHRILWEDLLKTVRLSSLSHANTMAIQNTISSDSIIWICHSIPDEFLHNADTVGL